MEGLALHLRLHFGDHSFLADICSLAASLKQTAVNVAASLKKTHICVDCNRGFTQRHGLFQHRQKHPNGSCKEKPFACEKCGKSFAQKNHLTLHERQHMDLPRNKNMTKPHTSSDENQMEEQPMESSSGDSSQRSYELKEESSEMEQVINNSMMIQHPEHLMSRHDSAGESSQRNTQDRKEIERVISNSMMIQSHPDHQLIDRHDSLSETNQRTSQSESRKELERSMVNPLLLQNHAERQRLEMLNRHSAESQRSLNSVPVALIARHPQRLPQSGVVQGNSNERMLPHHHHMTANQPTSEQGLPCIHPVAKQY